MGWTKPGQFAVIALLVATGPGLSGCTVLGAAVGSTFNSKPVPLELEEISEALVGRWVACADTEGRRFEGTATEVAAEYLVLRRSGDAFFSTVSDTVHRDQLVLVEVGNGSEGTDRGMTIGAAIDIAVGMGVLIASTGFARAPR